MSQLIREKLDQAATLVPRSGADVWLTFVRETSVGSDPALPLILEGGLTWESALLVSRTGKRIAVVGNYDADPLIASGAWDEVVPYVQSVRPPLLEALEKLVPQGGKIAINVSESDVMADGLSAGMRDKLVKLLQGTRFEGALVSAEDTVRALRGIKTSTELARIREAIRETDRLFADIEAFAKDGVTERAIYDHVHKLAGERGLTFSWDPVGDPIVNCGPDSMIGHGIPSATLNLDRGQIFHVDLGVRKDGYSSDIQRVWFTGDSVPEEVERAFVAVNAAITAGAAALRPGVRGHEVDSAARSTLVKHGYPEYMHAFGHQVGRMAHDGGAVLGPLWERYGKTPTYPIEVGEVYTLELGITVPGRGYLGLEEMAVVTESGCEFLSERPTSVPLL
jgi:Xaa-Pro dipeptidase